MARRSWYAVAAVATLALSACSEREPESTTGPQFAPGGNTDPCGFSNSLVTSYFPSSRQSSIISLKQSMANAGPGSETARTSGFEIMDSIGSVSRNFSVSPSAGAQLTVALIGCMFNNASFTYPTDPVSDFTAALNNAAGGAYYVRGGGTAGADVSGRSATVLGRLKSLDGETNLSGIRPSSSSWTSMLSGNSASEGRALIYGYPVTTAPLVFEWASVPSALTFSPEAVVSVCDGDGSGAAMVHEEAVGVLAYVNTSICDASQSLTMMERGWGPKALAARIGRMFARALAPAPLQATVVLTGTGGKTSTIPKSRFGKQSVTTLTLKWGDPETPPPALIKGLYPTTTFPVAVTVAASAKPVFGVCVYLSGTNNNGTPTKLQSKAGVTQDPGCTNPPGGDTDALSVKTQAFSGTASVAQFGDVGVTKTGAITITAVADVLGREGFGSITVKSNVKPLGK